MTQIVSTTSLLVPSATASPRRPERSGLWFTFPYVLTFILFLLWPVIASVGMSFTGASLTGRGHGFVGLSNYTEAFTDPKMWSAIGNTLFFTLISSVPLVLVGLGMALLVVTALPGQWLWRMSFFGPFLLASAVVTTVFNFIYQPNSGLLTGLLARIGIPEIGWISSEAVAMWSIALMTLWWTVGYNFLLYLAALQAIPEQLYEAASLDGAGPLRRLRSVTLPLLSRTTGLVVMLQVVASLKVFDQMYLLTKGGPDGATRSALEYIYDVGFSSYRLGYGTAISVIFFGMIILGSALSMLRTRKAN